MNQRRTKITSLRTDHVHETLSAAQQFREANPELAAEYERRRLTGQPWQRDSELGRFVAEYDRLNQLAMRTAGV